MKIVHLTSAHSRYDTRIFLKQCTSLAANNYKVSLVVADGKGDDCKNNVFIFDVGAPRGRLDRIGNAPSRVFKKAMELNADIYHLHDPELLPIGMKLKKKGKKVVFDIHEMTRLQIKSKQWIPAYLRNFTSLAFSKYEDYACKRFDYLIVPQVEMKDFFSEFSKCQTIFNYPEADYNLSDSKRSPFNIVYSGGMSEERGMMNYIALIESLILLDCRYKLILACKVSTKLADIVNRSPAKESIELVGYVDFDSLLKIYKESLFGLILFNNVGQYYMANALKLFEYMRSGLVVVMPDFGHWVEFNEENQSGFNVNVKDSNEIAAMIHRQSLETLLEISKHNTEVSEAKFSWKSEVLKLINVYKEIEG